MNENQEIIIEAYKDKMKKRLYGLLKEREKNGRNRLCNSQQEENSGIPDGEQRPYSNSDRH